MDTTKLVHKLPSRLLKAAYLVGKIPLRACNADPRVSYTLYIPENQYCAVHDRIQQQQSVSQLPLVVTMHGTLRAAAMSRDVLIDFADKRGVCILAPLFPAALDGPRDLHSYKQLRSKTLASDKILLSIVDEVSVIWPGIHTDTFSLVGFSGGGQFSHRFAYVHPERLRALCVGGPGSVTKIRFDEKWPSGLGDFEEVFGHEFDADAMRRIGNIRYVVGGADGEIRGLSDIRQWLADNHIEVNAASSGTTLDGAAVSEGRLQALTDLRENWLENGIQVDMTVVPDVGHEYPKILPSILDWLDEVYAQP